jgi:hypothetical protein
MYLACSLDLSFPSGTECLGIHLGDAQAANLGDGNGWVNQTLELRQDYGNSGLGSCLESLAGGNHLRLFRQNGPTANTGALFLACVCHFFVRRTDTDGIDQRFTGRGGIFLTGIADQFRNRFICLQNVLEKHTISPDGYDIGRWVHRHVYGFGRTKSDDAYSDKFVAGALQVTSYKGITYKTVAENITGLLASGSAGINHGE